MVLLDDDDECSTESNVDKKLTDVSIMSPCGNSHHSLSPNGVGSPKGVNYSREAIILDT